MVIIEHCRGGRAKKKQKQKNPGLPTHQRRLSTDKVDICQVYYDYYWTLAGGKAQMEFFHKIVSKTYIETYNWKHLVRFYWNTCCCAFSSAQCIKKFMLGLVNR